MFFSFLPKIKRCPCCKAINVVKVNGVNYENKINILSDWALKKKFNCNKCKVELGLFRHKSTKIENVFWIDFIKCENFYNEDLHKLQKIKNNLYEEQNNIIKNEKIKKKYYATVKKITDIQNKIRLNQTKLKIKVIIQQKRSVI